MDIGLQPGRYVLAVSGGVDSMVMLHALKDDPNTKLIVAHFDHGIREDSAEDRRLVQEVSRQYGLPFVYNEGKLGADASEAVARDARYRFLNKIRQTSGAQAIVTAHHQDDVLETAIINILRGTSRKGLTSLGSHYGLTRPMLHLPKNHLIAYAQDQGLIWREDSTNSDEAYLRNYIRHRIVPRIDPQSREQLLAIFARQSEVNFELDSLLAGQLHMQSEAGAIDRRWFSHLPHAVAREVLATWLRAHGFRSFSSRQLERLVVAAKTARPGRAYPISRSRSLNVTDEHLALS